MIHRFAFVFLWLLLFISCSSCSPCLQSSPKRQKEVASVPGPKAIIYKTRADYSKLIPIILSPDGKSIESYPDVKDVMINGIPSTPTPLHKGYLLDNRGITANVAFIRLSYEEYAALPVTPTADELMNMVVDKKPLKKMYSCGLRSKFGSIEELNTAIDAGNFAGFTRLK